MTRDECIETMVYRATMSDERLREALEHARDEYLKDPSVYWSLCKSKLIIEIDGRRSRDEYERIHGTHPQDRNRG